MVLYFVVVSAVGEKISKLKNPDDHKCFYLRTADILLYGKNISFSPKVLRLLKSRVEKELSAKVGCVTSEIKTCCAVFLGTNGDEDESRTLLKCLDKAFGLTHEDLYLMYRLAYRRAHPVMNFDDFLGYIPIHVFDMAIPDTGQKFLLKKIPSMIIRKLGQEMSFSERLELFMFLQHPHSNSSAKLIGKFLHSDEPSVVGQQIQIFRHFYNLVEQGKNADFVNLCNIMVFLYSCRGSYMKILSALSTKEKDFLKNECNKYLAAFRSLDTKAKDQTDFDYHVVCSYMAACFLRDTVSFWAAIKPLLLALRKSKKIWVPKDLKIMAGSLYHRKNLAEIILLLFDTQDEFAIEKELKQFRRDMADGLMELLKPLPDKKYKSGRAKKYSVVAQNREGFDPHATEPESLYRQGYINAVSELCIKGDGSGHTFFAELNRLALKDPSPKVQFVAKEAIKKLDNIPQTGVSYDQKALIKTALWHIWQAHVFAHEASYEEEAALETKVNLSR
jgi:hypothetical protein